MRFNYTNGQNTDFAFLCQRLDSSLNDQVGGEKNRSEYIELNSLADIHDVIIAYDNGVPVACGSFKKFDDECAEMKRIFVESAYRKKGVGRMLMSKLEDAAKNQGYQKAILETGRHMPAAMGLYLSIGYEIIENYGPYKGMEKSVCFGKVL